MTEAVGPRFPRFDVRVADGLIKANNEACAGLPHYLGVKFSSLTPGNLRATLEVRKELLTPFGNLHGGIMAALVDHVLGCVLYPLMERRQWAATTEFKLNYLAAVREGTLVAESTVVSFTKRTAVVRVEVANGDKLACVAQGTLLVVEATKT